MSVSKRILSGAIALAITTLLATTAVVASTELDFDARASQESPCEARMLHAEEATVQTSHDAAKDGEAESLAEIETCDVEEILIDARESLDRILDTVRERFDRFKDRFLTTDS